MWWVLGIILMVLLYCFFKQKNSNDSKVEQGNDQSFDYDKFYLDNYYKYDVLIMYDAMRKMESAINFYFKCSSNWPDGKDSLFAILITGKDIRVNFSFDIYAYNHYVSNSSPNSPRLDNEFTLFGNENDWCTFQYNFKEGLQNPSYHEYFINELYKMINSKYPDKFVMSNFAYIELKSKLSEW